MAHRLCEEFNLKSDEYIKEILAISFGILSICYCGLSLYVASS